MEPHPLPPPLATTRPGALGPEGGGGAGASAESAGAVAVAAPARGRAAARGRTPVGRGGDWAIRECSAGQLSGGRPALLAGGDAGPAA